MGNDKRKLFMVEGTDGFGLLERSQEVFVTVLEEFLFAHFMDIVNLSFCE